MCDFIYLKSKVLKELLKLSYEIPPVVCGNTICEECWTELELSTLNVGTRWFCSNDCMYEWTILSCGC